MNSLAPDPDHEILAQLMLELDAGGDHQAIVDRFCKRHPRLSSEAQELVCLGRQLELCRNDELAPWMPSRLGEFTVRRLIAIGGMGEVYEAEQERLNGRRVAIKVVRRGRVSALAEARFLREQSVLASLHQTHVVPVHTAGEQDGLKYFVMPLIQGASLNRLLDVTYIDTRKPNGETSTLGDVAERLISPSGDDQAKKSADHPSHAAHPTHSVEASLSADLGADRGAVTMDWPSPASSPDPERRQSLGESPIRLSRDYLRSVADVMIQASQAIQHAHHARFIHRDIKPSNLMVDRDGKCWLIDFGLAGIVQPMASRGPQTTATTPARMEASNAPDERSRVTSREQPVVSPDSHTDSLEWTPLEWTPSDGVQTVPGVLGTVPYLAPEQWAGRADTRSDVYGLGATLYELCTLRPPFSTESFADPREIAVRDPRPPRQLVPGLPRDLDAICLKAMHRRPERRYATAQDFADDLRRWLQNEPTRARPGTVLRRIGLWARRNPGWATALGVGIGLALVATWAVVTAAQAEARQARGELYLHRLRQLQTDVHEARWSTEGRELVAKLRQIDATEGLRDAASLTLRGLDAELIRRSPLEADHLAFYPDQRRVLVARTIVPVPNAVPPAVPESLRILDTATGQETTLTPPPFSVPGPIAMLPEGTPVQLGWIGKEPPRLQLWDLERVQARSTLELPESLGAVARVAPEGWSLTSDGLFACAWWPAAEVKPVSSSRRPRNVVVWDIVNESVKASWTLRGERFLASPDGQLVAAGDSNGEIQILEVASGEVVASLQSGHSAIQELAWRRDYLVRARPADRPWILAAGMAGGDIVIWDVDRQQIRSTCRGGLHEVHSLSFGPDGSTLVSGGRGHPLVWDVGTGRLLLRLDYFNNVTTMAMSPDGTRLAVGSTPLFAHNGGTDVWQLDERRGQTVLRGLASPIVQLRFSADGQWLAGLTHSWQLAVWHAPTRRLAHVFEVPVGMYAESCAIALEPNGQRVACSAGREAKVWEVASGRLTHSVPLPDGYFDQMVFSPAGQVLLFRQESLDAAQPPVGRNKLATRRACVLRNLLAPMPLTPLTTLNTFPTTVMSLHLSPTGERAIVEGLVPDADWAGGSLTGHARRVLQCVSLPDGRETWHHEARFTIPNQFAVALDSSGEILIRDVNTERHLLTRMETGETLRETPRDCVAYCEELQYWVRRHRTTEDDSHLIDTYTLMSSADAPLLTLGRGDIPSSLPRFHPERRILAWGLITGDIVVAELDLLNENLKKMKIGW